MLDDCHLWIEDMMLIYIFSIFCSPFDRPDDVMLKRTHDETVLLHCFLWPVVTFLVGVLIVVLTICAKSLAIRAEAIKKKKHLWVARLRVEKRNLQEGLRWGSLTHLQVCGAPSCISFQGLICGGIVLVSGLFLGDCPLKWLLIASSAMAPNKYILPKKKRHLHCTKYAVCC